MTTSRTFSRELPEAVMRQVLRSMDQQDRERLTRVLEYPAGHRRAAS